MRKTFEAAAQAYENVKKTVQEKWEAFKNKFEGTKTGMSQEVLSAKTPEDLIALGKKLQEQGEALKLEEESVKQEDTNNAHNEALGEIKMQTEAWDDNKQFDENKAAEKAENERAAAEQLVTEQAEAQRVAAEEQAAHEQYVQQQTENEETRLAEIRAKLSGEESATVESPGAVTEKLVQEKEPIDVIAMNNEIVNMPHHKQQEALDNLTEDQVAAVGRFVATEKGFDSVYQTLSNFKFKKEIMALPAVTEALKDVLKNGRTHIYNVDRVLHVLPESLKAEILSDSSVKNGLIESSANSMKWAQDKSDRDAFLKKIGEIGFSSEDISKIGNLLREDSVAINALVDHFGSSNVYSNYSK